MICYPNVKINLGLHVLRKRPDGYHDLETLFVPYHGLHDTLEIIEADDYSRTLAGLRERYGSLSQAISPDGKLMMTIARKEGVDWDPLKDLTAKAYFLLAQDFQLPSMKFFLEKGSPVGAGLGGGSADAAFALKAIAELAGLGLPDASLATIWQLPGRGGTGRAQPSPSSAPAHGATPQKPTPRATRKTLPPLGTTAAPGARPLRHCSRGGQCGGTRASAQTGQTELPSRQPTEEHA